MDIMETIVKKRSRATILPSRMYLYVVVKDLALIPITVCVKMGILAQIVNLPTAPMLQVILQAYAQGMVNVPLSITVNVITGTMEICVSQLLLVLILSTIHPKFVLPMVNVYLSIIAPVLLVIMEVCVPFLNVIPFLLLARMCAMEGDHALVSTNALVTLIIVE